MFVAEFEHGKPALTVVTVIKETSKTYQVNRDAATKLIGSLWVPNRLHKDYNHIFPTLEKALAWLMERAGKYADQCENKYHNACATVAELQEALWAIREGNQHDADEK